MKFFAVLLPLLIMVESQAVATKWPPEVPLTSQSMSFWLKSLCSSATCQPVKPDTLVPTHLAKVFPDSKVYIISKSGYKFYLFHDFIPNSAATPLSELTFMPYKVSQRWEPKSLKIVANWLNMLSSGELASDALSQCIQQVKEQGSEGASLDPSGKRMNFLKLNQTETATGSCYWLNNKHNIGFGFSNKGRY